MIGTYHSIENESNQVAHWPRIIGPSEAMTQHIERGLSVTLWPLPTGNASRQTTALNVRAINIFHKRNMLNDRLFYHFGVL